MAVFFASSYKPGFQYGYFDKPFRFSAFGIHHSPNCTEVQNHVHNGAENGDHQILDFPIGKVKITRNLTFVSEKSEKRRLFNKFLKDEKITGSIDDSILEQLRYSGDQPISSEHSTPKSGGRHVTSGSNVKQRSHQQISHHASHRISTVL